MNHYTSLYSPITRTNNLNPPEQQMISGVFPAGDLGDSRTPEVLIPIPAGDDQQLLGGVLVSSHLELARGVGGAPKEGLLLAALDGGVVGRGTGAG